MKKIILIGGTDRSGSTLLDMVLGNGRNCMSLGEVYALFFPHQPHHFVNKCICGDENCNVFNELKKYNHRNFYNKIFNNFNTSVIVDSSKLIPWFIDAHSKVDREQVSIRNILIFKDPLDYAYSKWKRNQLSTWRIYYKKYHKIYLNSFGNVITINLSQLIRFPKNSTRRLCHLLGIDYSDGKEDFWENETHHLFGTGSIRRVFLDHIHRGVKGEYIDKNFDSEFERVRNRIEKEILNDEELVSLQNKLQSLSFNQINIKKEEPEFDGMESYIKKYPYSHMLKKYALFIASILAKTGVYINR